MRYKQNNEKQVIRQGKFTILGFQQSQLVNFGFDVKLAFILRYLVDFEASQSPKIKRWYYNEVEETDDPESCFLFDHEGKSFVDYDNGVFQFTWLLHEKLIIDLPILHIEKRQLRRHLIHLEELGLIKTIVVRGRYSYFRTIKENVAILRKRHCGDTVSIPSTDCKPVTDDSLPEGSRSFMTGNDSHSRQAKDNSFNNPSYNAFDTSHNEVNGKPSTNNFNFDEMANEVFNDSEH
jgi:hypothetical protein